ncbi:MAG TPA: hypothetical protein VF476_01750 [Chitinophagaceae bacterium]
MKIIALSLLFLIPSHSFTQGTYDDWGFISEMEIFLNYSQKAFAHNKVREVIFANKSSIDTILRFRDSSWFGINNHGLLAYRRRKSYHFESGSSHYSRISYDTIYFSKRRQGFCKHVDSLVFDSAVYNSKGEITSLYWKGYSSNERTLNVFNEEGELLRQITLDNTGAVIAQRKYIYLGKQLSEINYYFFNTRERYIKDEQALAITAFEPTAKKSIAYESDGQLRSIAKYHLDHSSQAYQLIETDHYIYKNGFLDHISTIDGKTGKETFWINAHYLIRE